MAPTSPVQTSSIDVQRDLLASRYAAAKPLEAVLPGTQTAAPKADEKHPFASRDWFERSSEKADGGRTALKNLMTRMKGIADAAAQREAAARVQSESAQSDATPAPESDAVAYGTGGSATSPAPATTSTQTTTDPAATTGGSGSTSGPGNGNGNGNGLIKQLLG